MTTFFNPKIFKAKRSDEPFTDFERDTVYNLYFAAVMTALEISQLLRGRSEKAVKRQLQIVHYTENASIIHSYKPSEHRESRVGKDFTQNEILLIIAHHKRHIGLKRTAIILMRTVDEIAIQKVELKLKVPAHYGVEYGPRN